MSRKNQRILNEALFLSQKLSFQFHRLVMEFFILNEKKKITFFPALQFPKVPDLFLEPLLR